MFYWRTIQSIYFVHGDFNLDIKSNGQNCSWLFGIIWLRQGKKKKRISGCSSKLNHCLIEPLTSHGIKNVRVFKSVFNNIAIRDPRFLSAIAVIKLFYHISSYSWRWWYMLWDSSKWGYLWQWKVLLGSSWGICNGQTFRKSNVRRKRFSGNERKDWEISENISWNMELLLESYDWSQVRSLVQDKVKIRMKTYIE